jgi:hypothetical protein
MENKGQETYLVDSVEGMKEDEDISKAKRSCSKKDMMS